MNYRLTFSAIIVSAFLVVGCKDNQTYKKIGTTPQQTQTSTQSDIHKIVVNDFIEAGTYAYLQVEENGKEYWMAIPNSPVEIGATFYYTGGMLMRDFKSEQLNKTFDEIVFVEGISASENMATKPGAANPHITGEIPIPEVSEINISQPSNGVSVGKLFADKEKFKNKEVIVKGKVVKVNNGIMDKNWVHIADGTTFENKKDITVTTTEIIKVGDTVTFKATLVLDKDFGAGYVYGVLLENGAVINE